MSTTSPSRIQRFSFAERAVHWLAAGSFFYAALSGLSLWTPQLYWLATVFGGGEATRRWHPWGGVVFGLALAKMFLGWARQMKLDASDRAWLRRSHRYAVHDHEGLPEAGRFNGGQKMLFWIQSLAFVFLFVSGLVLWFPELTSVPRGLRFVAILVHPAAAIVAMGGIIVLVYMGTAAVPGAFRGMVRGWVDHDWARAHHPKWFRDIEKS